ncbi:MAG: acyl-CoA dehydrogenase family protein [Desulfatiglans sp.]|jgi:alkylation response protein AidB-like acyl-CoA dehydrogenase|nr:acyl-CoA dehydrogenase family protein [Thermodesulfobacteriota bacterium]MEE4353625.1 acyl-CoA dehydrogenase family protein [Desulfatiglans sp.]
MDFDLTDLQTLLLSSAGKFLENEVRGVVREVEKSEEGHSFDVWKKMAELGWLGVVFPQEYGGIDGDFTDLAVLVEEMGKVLFPGPYIPTLISGLAILEYGSKAQKEQFLSDLIKGHLVFSPAIIGPDLSMGTPEMEEAIIREEARFVVSGTRLFAPFAHVADWLLYSAHMDEGPALMLIDTRAPGVRVTALDSIGVNKPCEVVLKDVTVPRNRILGHMGQGRDIIGKLESWGALAESAYIAGMLGQILKMSVEYAKEREQFNRPIGTFQAIQHKCADMATDLDQVKFLTYKAAWTLSRKLPAAKEISMAKSWASDASRRVAFMGVMIHGGNGVSAEHDMQLYFRRAKSSEMTFGDGDFHREIIAEELGL